MLPFGIVALITVSLHNNRTGTTSREVIHPSTGKLPPTTVGCLHLKPLTAISQSFGVLFIDLYSTQAWHYVTNPLSECGRDPSRAALIHSSSKPVGLKQLGNTKSHSREGPERWFSGWEYQLFFQKTQVQLTAPPATLVPVYLAPSSDLYG